MKLKNKKIVILIEHHYQDMEVWVPYFRFIEEGAHVVFAGTGTASEYSGKFGYPAKVQLTADQLQAQDFDAVLIPGGWAPDFLRRHAAVIRFVKEMNQQGKLVASICHGGWVLASAEIVQGRTVTSFSAIKDDLIHAGARFVDQEVAVDKNLVTARKPEDLPAFCRTMIEFLARD